MFAFKESVMDRSNNYNLSEIAMKSGFKFRDIENRRLDWKALGCIDVNKVIENQDYEFLEKITPKIIEAPMQSILGTAALEPAVSSLFRLSQMCLQYLSFCQQFMSHTLYDLRTAFNQLQKKYSNLKQNYKCLEEQHYKAQERIQSLLSENKGQRKPNGDDNIIQSKPTSLFPCDQCTKNFLTHDSLKSHQHRKHTIAEEKCELSDDNEKGSDYVDDKNVEEIDEKHTDLPDSAVQSKDVTADPEPQLAQSNNNNNDHESNTNCVECMKKVKIPSSSIAIQCEVTPLSVQPAELGVTIESTDSKLKTIPEESKEIESVAAKEQAPFLDNELIQSAYETINDLKKEILDLKNSLEINTFAQPQQTVSENLTAEKESSSVHSNDKIEVIEQKLNAFETMYTESQNQFIESFRTLDERQKVYMDNIQETIKDIVEKSLGQNDVHSTDTLPINDTTHEDIAETRNERNDLVHENEAIDKPNLESGTVERKSHDEKVMPELKPDAKPDALKECVAYESTSDVEEDDRNQTQLTFKADVHVTSQSDSRDPVRDDKNRSRKVNKKLKKEKAIGEFEQRLRQLGVDTETTGLSTPRSCEVNQDLAEERDEMKKAHKSFDATRKKLKQDIERIAKEKLQSASSVTSLSSLTNQSDEQTVKGNSPIKPIRPKSASVQQMRKRNAKKLMDKYVENDIDENDIMDKMKMAQQAINAHRECIQELLGTTAHSPSTLAKMKYPSGTKGTTNQPNGIGTESDANQYNKMPNVTTRRVVFVNLDEDS